MSSRRLPARINFITLACRDMDRMTRFYRQFGWPEAPSSEPVHVVFQCKNGVVLGLYAAANFEASLGPMPDGFRGFALSINCVDEGEVRRLYETIRGYDDVHDLDPPTVPPWGGLDFGFRDPEGNIWGVTWVDGSTFDDNEGLTFP